MKKAGKAAPFNLNDVITFSTIPSINRAVEKIAERLFGLHKLSKKYAALPPSDDVKTFLNHSLAALQVTYNVVNGKQSIAPSGPIIVVANHPYGALDGLVLATLLLKIRPDVKILANYFLTRIPELADLFISVDPFETSKAIKSNIRPLREALRWIQGSGLLLVFPAGEVSHPQRGRNDIVDIPWSNNIARLARKSQAPVVPVYIHGKNSLKFQLASLIHPKLRLAMIPRELTNKTNYIVDFSIAPTIAPSKLSKLGSDEEITAYLRMCTYMQRDRQVPPGISYSSESRIFRTPYTPSLQRQQLRDIQTEVALLPTAQCLLDQGEFQVYYAAAMQIPKTLDEIGRLREICFRTVGEGTGKTIDIDRFDHHYSHLFLWNSALGELVGAYRFGVVVDIVRKFGKDGLYTHSLFRYKNEFVDSLSNAVELGRSFIRLEYQKSFSPLLLLWKGIGKVVEQRLEYPVLFGAVSISNDYNTVSKQLMVDFFTTNNYSHELARYVKPRKPFRNSRPTWRHNELVFMQNIEALSDLIEQTEFDKKRVPILLKQYMKLGGKLLGFNVDKNFSHALDGLIMVDLFQTDPKLLHRYLGIAGTSPFHIYHNNLKPIALSKVS